MKVSKYNGPTELHGREGKALHVHHKYMANWLKKKNPNNGVAAIITQVLHIVNKKKKEGC